MIFRHLHEYDNRRRPRIDTAVNSSFLRDLHDETGRKLGLRVHARNEKRGTSRSIKADSFAIIRAIHSPGIPDLFLGHGCESRSTHDLLDDTRKNFAVSSETKKTTSGHPPELISNTCFQFFFSGARNHYDTYLHLILK